MAADFKSHVLRRDEKGVFGVPFKRWLLAGCAAGIAYMILSFALPAWSIPLAFGVLVGMVILTGPRGGIPLWLRLIYRLRGSLLLAASRQPAGMAGQLAQMLELPVDLARLDGARIFAPPQGEVLIDLSEWITYAYADEEDGLVFVDGPLEG